MFFEPLFRGSKVACVTGSLSRNHQWPLTLARALPSG